MPKFTVYHMDWQKDKMKGYLDLHQELMGEMQTFLVNRKNWKPVAEVTCNSLDDVFELTNTIDRLWWENPEVKVLDRSVKGFRSTSVTDIVEDEAGLLHLCAPFGWKAAIWKKEKRR